MVFLAFAVRQTFAHVMVLATFSKADAQDLDAHQPTPEAPRTLADLLVSTDRLPLGLQARGEFEYVGQKPLGTGCPNPDAQCVGVPVKEYRGAIVRPFAQGRVNFGVNFLIVRGATGQTTESFLDSPVQQIVGVRIPSYTSVSATYRFGGHPSY